MNTTFYKIVSVVAFGALIGGSCKKEFPPLPDPVPVPAHNAGCNDPDSPFYNPNDSGHGDCKYAYATSYEITYYPSQDNGSDWDFGFGNSTNADLLLNITLLGDDVKILQGEEKTNHNPNSPATWSEVREIRLLNKNYHWDLSDYDATSPNDPISNGNFNPIDYINNNGVTGSITVQNGGSQLVIYYVIK